LAIAVIGLGRQRREEIIAALVAAIVSFHAPDRGENFAGHAITRLDVREQRGILIE